MLRKLLIVLFLVPLLAGCGRDSDTDAPETAAAPPTPETVADPADHALFERIDADTAMIYANLLTLPDEISDMVWNMVGALYEGQEEAMAEAADLLVGRSPLLAAMFRDIGTVRSAEDFEARGLASNDLWAMHMISVYPVAHFRLVDGEAFEAWLNRLAEEAETEWPERVIDGERLIWSDMGGFGIALHNDGEIATLGLVADDDLLLRRIANLDQPASAFQPRDLQSFNQARGLTAYGSGFFEFQRFFSRLLDDSDEQSAPLREAMDMHRAAADAACDRELEALFAQIPRLSFGMPGLSMQEISMLMRIETHGDLGQRLAPIADTPVGLDVSNPRLLSAGLALNLIAARDFGRELVGGWVENPPQCALFEGVRENASDWQLALNRPIPPFITGMHGLRVDLERFRMVGSATGVEDVSGTMTLFMRNPQMLLGMAQMFSPELAALELQAGGDPQALPAEMTEQFGGIPAWVALGEQALGMAVGDGQKDRLQASMQPGEADNAVFAYSINVPAYASMLDELAAIMASDSDDNGVELDFNFLGMMLDQQEESQVSIRLHEQGIDIISTSLFRQ